MFFARPDNLYWLLILVPMVGAAIWYVYWSGQLRDAIGDPELVEAMAESRSRRLRGVRFGLLVVGVALLCLATARPKWGRTAQTIDQSGIDIVFGLDLSKSMLARDVPPSRLEAATGEIETVLDRLGGDRVGMVVFTTVSFVQSPLTTDYGALRFYLEKLDPSQMSVGGTAIGRALRDSVELLTGTSFDDDDSQATRNARVDRAKNQIVVLVTDGEDHESNPVEAAKTARKRGIRVVTVGVGGDRGAKIPIMNDNGGIRGYKRNRSGDLVRTALREKQLKEIARAGGGTYIRYDREGSVAKQLQAFVDKLESSRLQSKVAEQYHDRYLWFAVPAFVLILMSFLLGERSAGRFGWGTSESQTLLVLLVACALGVAGCNDLLRAPHDTVEQGNDKLKSGDFQGALDRYGAATDELDPVPARLHYNRGLALLGREKYDAARSAFGNALGSDDPSVQFDAHHGVGLAFARQEKWKKAVEAYERALRMYRRHPDDISKEALAAARHNLELVYRKLYPPCSSQEDELEENDKPSNASILNKKPQKKGLTLCGLDDDWFEVSAVPGATVRVEATFRKLGEHDDPEHTFLPKPEDLRVEMYGAEGEERLAEDRGSSEGDSTDQGPVERTIEEFVVDEETPLGSNSSLLVRVAAADKLKFEYDISIEVTPPCHALQEKSESNDSRESAAQLQPGSHRMQLCAEDTDWFQVDAQMGDSIFVDVKPVARNQGGEAADPEQLRLTMFDASTGREVGRARRDGTFWTAGIHGNRRDRTLRFRVDAPNQDVETSYRLDVYSYPPCMVGDDRHEENDSVSNPATFGRKQRRKRHYRYLRLCPDDPDFFAFRPPKRRKNSGKRGRPGPGGGSGSQKSGPSKPKKLRLGLQTAPDPERDPPDVSIAAYHPKTGDVRAEGKAPKEEASTQSSGDESVSRFDRVLSVKPTGPKQKIPVGVSGDSTFYHLSKLSGGGGSQNNRDQNNKRNKKNRNNQKQSNQNKSDQNKRQKNRQKDRQKSAQNKKPPKKHQKRDKQSAKKRATEDILKALENSDKNFQMRKALDKNKRSGGNVDKDW